jgi:hypothetical protein
VVAEQYQWGNSTANPILDPSFTAGFTPANYMTVLLDGSGNILDYNNLNSAAMERILKSASLVQAYPPWHVDPAFQSGSAQSLPLSFFQHEGAGRGFEFPPSQPPASTRYPEPSPEPMLPYLPAAPDSDTLQYLLKTYFGSLFLSFPVCIRSETMNLLSKSALPDYLAYTLMFWTVWYSTNLPAQLGRRRHRDMLSALFARLQACLMPSLEATLVGYDAIFGSDDKKLAWGRLSEEEVAELRKRKDAYKTMAVNVLLALLHLISIAMAYKT